MINHFDSGLYTDPFYTKHQLDFCSDHSLMEKVEFNDELLAQHYQDHYDFIYDDEENECDKWEQVNEQFWDALSYSRIYFEPMIFDEKIALECGLTPFTYQEKGMLALSGCGMDLSAKLDTYQALVHCTIDKCSKLFTTCARDYFEYVVGKDATRRVLEAVFYDGPSVSHGV